MEQTRSISTVPSLDTTTIRSISTDALLQGAGRESWMNMIRVRKCFAAIVIIVTTTGIHVLGWVHTPEFVENLGHAIIIVTLLLTGSTTALLLMWAESSVQLISLAGSIMIWIQTLCLAAIAFGTKFMKKNGYNERAIRLFGVVVIVVWTLLFLISDGWMPYMALMRITALERASLCDLKSHSLRRRLYWVALAGMVWIASILLLVRLLWIKVSDGKETNVKMRGSIESVVAMSTSFVLASSYLHFIAGVVSAFLHIRRRLLGHARLNAQVEDASPIDEAISEVNQSAVLAGLSLFTSLCVLVQICVTALLSEEAATTLAWTVFNRIPPGLDASANSLCLLVLSGVLTRKPAAAEIAERAVLETQKKRVAVSRLGATFPDPRWQAKVEELANRGVSLGQLLSFWRGLGTEYMMGFCPEQHTTADVVRHAIIPQSASKRCSLSEVFNNGRPVRPKRMITHNWRNRFRDLLAAAIADALDECEFGIITYFLSNDVDKLEEMIRLAGKLHQTYWICAICVSQHDSICDKTFGGKDTVTGIPYPVCNCGKTKILNDTSPILHDGRSIECELNKFSDMMTYLAYTDSEFEQVVAVDASFGLFWRAWCMSELARGDAMFIPQHLKIISRSALENHRDSLRSLRVEDMQATRNEDIEGILSEIRDKDAFNRNLQRLIFDNDHGLFAIWHGQDSVSRMDAVGRLARWHLEEHHFRDRQIFQHIIAADADHDGEIELSRMIPERFRF